MEVKVSEQSLKRNNICAQSHSIFPNIIINYEKKSRDFTVEKSGRHHLHQVIKVNGTNDKT